MELVLAAVCLVIGVGALARIRDDPRVDGPFVRKSLVAMIWYALFVGAGVLLMAGMVASGDRERLAVTGTGFFLAWTLLAGVWLTRLAPRLKDPPGWLMRRWTILDFGLIAISAGFALAGVLP